MSSAFVSIEITDHHRKILERNKEKIISFYKLEGDELQLVEVMAKVIPESGTYYKFTVMDRNRKAVIAKIDDLHSRPRWSAQEWIQR